jgi:thiol-disulfide isomerase/thioredoxin
MKKVVLVLIATLAVLSCGNAQDKVFSKESLTKKLITQENTEIAFEDILKKHEGKITVIEVWASWCSDCVKAVPKVKQMQADFPNVDYVFLSADKAFDKWQAGIQKHELKGDHYWITDGMKGDFGKSIDLDWIPRYIIIDKTGKIVIYRAIETDFEKMYEQIKKLQ